MVDLRSVIVVSGLSEPLAEKVSTVISQSTSDENNSLPPTSSLAIYNSDYLTAHAQSAKHIHAALRGRAFLDPDSKDENEKRLLETLALDEAVSAGSEGISAGTAIEGLALLDEWKSGQTTRRQYIQRARDRWKQTTVFQRELASLEE